MNVDHRLLSNGSAWGRKASTRALH